jgi:phytoene dehydrogenase-like protein
VNRKKAIIIGSGVGGSGVGALLASEGNFEVTLVERSNLIGGRFAGLHKDGFQLDVGCHMLANCEKGTLGKILSQCGSPDYVEWRYARKPSPIISFCGERVKFPFEAHKMGFSPTDIEHFMEFHNAISAMSPADCDRHMDISVRDFVSRYIDKELVRSIVAFFAAIYFVAADDQVPVGEYALCQNEMNTNKALGYPVGGTGAIPEAYCRIIRENGGQVTTGKGVKRILIENGRAKGVRLVDDVVIDGDLVISNASIKDTVLTLVGEDAYPSDFVERVSSYQYSLNTHAIKIALNEPISEESMIFYIGYDDLQAVKRSMAEGTPLPERGAHLMIPVVSNLDPALAPEGRQIMIAGGGGHRPIDAPPEDWKKWDEELMATVKNVFPGIEDHILWTVSHNASRINSMFGEEGSVIGVAQTIGQVGADRPPIVDPFINGLFHCSADTGQHGIGGELAADSALRLYEVLVG